MMQRNMSTSNRHIISTRALWMLMVMHILLNVQATHFRGGTISWRAEGGTDVRFFFRLGWTYGSGSGCKPSLIGTLVQKLSSNWTCLSNNCGVANLHDVNYFCTGANKAEDWEQGENNFTYTFPGKGPFTVGYVGGWWISLANGKGNGNWSVATHVDLRQRSDIGTPNSSPKSQSRPIYYVQVECENRIKLPVVDLDDDAVRCRWARGKECISVCSALPNAYLDEEKCLIVFNTTTGKNGYYTQNGVYAVAVVIEDFPRTPITLDGNAKKTPNDALSSVPLQFLVKTVPQTGPCEAGPRFIPPTPKENEVIVVVEGGKVEIHLYADNGNDTQAKANQISATGPVGLIQGSIIASTNHTDAYTSTLTWCPKHNDIGNHIVCASATNDKGRSSEQRCFTLRVFPQGCMSSPCQNKGQCVGNGVGTHACVCRPGFTGKNCEVDIDDCAVSHLCPMGMLCVDGVNTYTCVNRSTTTAITSTLASSTKTTTTTATTLTTITQKNGVTNKTYPVVYEQCSCVFRPLSDNDRNWMGVTRQQRDAIMFSFGVPFGLALNVFTFYTLSRRLIKHCGFKPQRKGCTTTRVHPIHLGGNGQ